MTGGPAGRRPGGRERQACTWRDDAAHDGIVLRRLETRVDYDACVALQTETWGAGFSELVPLENPYALRARDTLWVRCLVDGRPVADQTVIAGWQRGTMRPRQTMLRANAEGVASVPLTSSGKWFVKFVHMAPADDPSLDYESKWATLTFEVR